MQTKDFSHIERGKSLKELSGQTFDLAIVGGGINGAGALRDAASRGMSVILVEANDFAFGTSSRSSKLIHGGLRYLENLELGLVFEALSERRVLFEIAPHLLHPLRFFIPVYKNSRVGLFKMGLGMWLYDILALFDSFQTHERLSQRDSLERVPTLSPHDLKGAYVYSDAYTDDSRLVFETLRSAHNWGAHCLNYFSAEDVLRKGEKIVGLKCRDKLKGGTYDIYAKHIVSTVGPWTDSLASHWFEGWQPKLRPSKGIHVTISNERWPLKDALVLPVPNSTRIIFVIPREEMVLLGTTDSDFKGNPAEVVAHKDEVLSLLETVNSYFPKVNLEVEDIISSYAGVRPLVGDDINPVIMETLKSQADTTEEESLERKKSNSHGKITSKVSREHVILEYNQNLTFIMGGKYTTYRRMAEETLEVVLKNFSLPDRIRFHQSHTKQAINPYITFDKWHQVFLEAEKMAENFHIPVSEIKRLLSRHGGEAHRWLQRWSRLIPKPSTPPSQMSPSQMPPSQMPPSQMPPSQMPPSQMPPSQMPPSLFLEVHQAITQTMCLNLKDFYLRRIPLFLSEKDHGLSFIEDIADIFTDYFYWDDKERKTQINQLKESISKELAWKGD